MLIDAPDIFLLKDGLTRHHEDDEKAQPSSFVGGAMILHVFAHRW